MAKKKTTEKALNIDNILFNCRDYLRAARNSGSFFEKRDMMLKIYMSKETQNKLAEKFVKSNVGLQQAQLFAGHAGLKLKNKLSS